jgi:hypothetical protein
MLLGLLVACAGCVDMDTPDSDIAERPGTSAEDHRGLLQRLPAPASCSAVTAMAAQQESSFHPDACAAFVDVAVSCQSPTQQHTWIRIGLIVGTDVTTYDTTYACNKTVSHTFAVPCDAESISGGAILDHPQTSEDVSCLSAPI